ncbi:MAG: hypothetical protein AB1510_12940 [Bacillota bacterium]
MKLIRRALTLPDWFRQVPQDEGGDSPQRTERIKDARTITGGIVL